MRSLPRLALAAELLAAAAIPALHVRPAFAAPAAYTIPAAPIHYRTVKVDGLDIFYREAGPKDAPVILLLHGFPSSSHEFRDLIPLLADKYRVVAPDYPGFGYSSQPSRADYAYTFDHLYQTVDAFTRAVDLGKFAIYIQDYGAPVGLRFVVHQPERITGIIVQNGNAYEVGLSPAWKPIQAYWQQDTQANRDALRPFLKEQTTIFQYSQGVPDDRRNPDAWHSDQATLDRPGNDEIQLDLFHDYRTNVALYPAAHESFRAHRFPTLIVWGKADPFFTVPGAEAYKQDLPDAEIHLLDAGHFALETNAAEIAGYIRDFMNRTQQH